MEAVHAGLRVFHSFASAFRCLGWFFLVWCANIAAIDMALRSVGLDLPLVAPVALLVGQYLGSVVPSPGRLGTHQAVSIGLLLLFGVSLEVSAAFSIVVYLALVGIPVLAGAGALWYEVSLRGDRRLRAPAMLRADESGAARVKTSPSVK